MADGTNGAVVYYTPVPTAENEIEQVKGDRARLARNISRKVRSLSSVPTLGCSGTICWALAATYKIVFFYLAYASCCVYYVFRTGTFIHDALGLPSHKFPYVMGTLQFLAAFLTGLTMNEAGLRYKTAMSALLRLEKDTETLRVSLLSATSDPKAHVAVQCLLTWMMVIGRKNIVFFTEDYTDPIAELIPRELSSCVLFEPEVLFMFELSHFQYMFTNILMNAQLWDAKEKTVEKMFYSMLDAWNELFDLFQVRSPSTKLTVGNIAVSGYLLVIPLVTDDFVEACILPLLAGLFFSILFLAAELSDPWGHDGFHDLPLKDVMCLLGSPMWKAEDEGRIAESITWFNSGLTHGEWSFSGDHPIPRERMQKPNKGEHIDFADMRTLAQVAGFKTWDKFLAAARQDMEQSEARGRRMPSYLRWRCNAHLMRSYI